MLRPRVTILLLLALAAGCAQVRRVGKPEAGARPDSPEAAGESPGSRKRTVRAAPDRPPVPATPDALVTDAGAEELEAALVEKGYLEEKQPGARVGGATAAALRRFQADEGLAETGFPDRETLRRLGLDPQKVYRTTDDADGQPR